MSFHTRRRFLQGSLALASLGLLSGCTLLPQGKQPAKVPRVGFLLFSAAPSTPYPDAFRQGLRELGYAEGQTIAIEWRFADRADLLAELVAELVRLPVDVIVAAPVTAARAARQATETIPIVLAYGDPVTQGLVTSLAHPGGNVTGLSSATAELSGKRLQLLKEALPGISRIAVLWGTNLTDRYLKETEVAARALGVQLQALGVRDPSDLESAFSAMRTERAEALVVLPAAIFTAVGASGIVELAAQMRLPTIFESSMYVDTGGLLAYGPNLADLTRRTATYVDKILKGAKPADLPVEQPTKFDFVINLKTAQALGADDSPVCADAGHRSYPVDAGRPPRLIPRTLVSGTAPGRYRPWRH